MKTKLTLTKLALILMLFGCLFPWDSPFAQVTIGDGIQPQSFSILEVVSNRQGGLRLPQLSTAERDAITDNDFKDNALAEGLAIYNTTTKCYEYWNSNRWVSICKGDADLTFTDDGGNPADPFTPNFDCLGETRGPYTPHDTQDCSGIPEAFSYFVMIGDSYTTVELVNPITGQFKLTMSPNPTARSRNAVLRITNNCTGEYKEFLFMQNGCDDLCQPGVTKPIINTSNSGVICSTGAVYLNITNADPSAVYIWTLNEVELPNYTGKSYCVASQTGTYRVYVGAIGCDMNASDRVSVTINGGSTAPAAVGSIQATNKGVICGTTPVTITAYDVPSTGTLTWYLNGVKQNLDGQNPISVNQVGDWFAVMQDAGCTSKPSNTINVTSNPTGVSLDTPIIDINGTNMSTAILCKGGAAVLTVTNAGTGNLLNNVTYRWYNGQTLLGTGTKISIVIPNSSTMLLRCVASDNAAVYCESEASRLISLDGTAPSKPTISGNGYICDGASAALIASPAGQAKYTWFRDGIEVFSSTTTNVYYADLTGSYQVQTANGGCLSQMSSATQVAVSGYSNVSFSTISTASAVPGQVVTYEVTASKNPTSYVWTLDPANGAVLLDGSNPNTVQSTTTTNYIRVRMSDNTTPHTVTIKCYAVNACGNGDPDKFDVAVAPEVNCIMPNISNVTLSPSGAIMAGVTINMSVSVSNYYLLTDPRYQWYKNGAPISGATADIYSISNASSSDIGEYSVTVTSCPNASDPKDIKTATAIAGEITSVQEVAEDGSGILSGEDCFDVNSSINSNNLCGLSTSRSQADFTKKYTYTFKNIGTANKNLRWTVVESEPGKMVDYANSSIEINNVANTLQDGGLYTISLKFKESLLEDAKGTTNTDPWIVTIYATYELNGKDYKVLFRVLVKDCACTCGAYADNTKTTFLTFMCYNLGANAAIDPDTFYDEGTITNDDVKGFLFQWGRQADGHQSRTSGVTDVAATGNSAGHGLFIAKTSLYDWRENGYDNSTGRWGVSAFSGVMNPDKGPYDPCPEGWKVPSHLQWSSIINGIGFSSGAPNAAWKPWQGTGTDRYIQSDRNSITFDGLMLRIGDRLALPLIGYRDPSTGQVYNMGNGPSGSANPAAGYWSSTYYNPISGLKNPQAVVFTIKTAGITGEGNDGINPITFLNIFRNNGYAVRCIKE